MMGPTIQLQSLSTPWKAIVKQLGVAFFDISFNVNDSDVRCQTPYQTVEEIFTPYQKKTGSNTVDGWNPAPVDR